MINLEWFNRIVKQLQEWRSADHEDAITLHRNEIIEILEGIKILRKTSATQ